MEQFKNESGRSGRSAIFSLANDLSKHGWGRVVLVFVGVYMWIGTALHTSGPGQSADYTGLGLILGALPIALAVFGRWRAKREERARARAMWSTVLLLAGVVVGLGFFAVFLFRRRKSKQAALPELSPADIDRLADAELLS